MAPASKIMRTPLCFQGLTFQCQLEARHKTCSILTVLIETLLLLDFFSLHAVFVSDSWFASEDSVLKYINKNQTCLWLRGRMVQRPLTHQVWWSQHQKLNTPNPSSPRQIRSLYGRNATRQQVIGEDDDVVPLPPPHPTPPRGWRAAVCTSRNRLERLILNNTPSQRP